MSRRWLWVLWIGFSGCGDDTASTGSGGASSSSSTGGDTATSSQTTTASSGGESSTGGTGGATGGSGGTGGSLVGGGGGFGGFGGTGGATGGASIGGAGGAVVGGGGGFGGMGVGGDAVGGGGGAGGGSTGTRVRIAAANLSTGNFQNYDGGEGIRIIRGASPDVILVQEMNYLANNAASFTSFTTQTCGASCVNVRGPVAQIPNGIVSRYPILANGSIVDPGVTDRTLVWARIDVPGDRDLWAMSVHFRTANPAARDAEAVVVRDFFQNIVPAGDLAVLGGDFNTDVLGEPALVTLSAVFRTTAPYPSDQNANGMTNASRTKPYDWVLADTDLDALEIPVILGSRVFVGGMVVDTRVHTPITDLSPALSTDSGAPSMQHMLVVKDYLVP